MIVSETICAVGSADPGTGTNLHLNLPDLGALVDGHAVTPADVLASAAAFKRLYKPWALALADGANGTPALRDAVNQWRRRRGLDDINWSPGWNAWGERAGSGPAMNPKPASVTIEAEVIAPVPHDTRPQRGWKGVREMLEAFEVVSLAVERVLAVRTAWFGLPQIIAAYVKPTVAEHHQMRCNLTGWYAGTTLARTQAFYYHIDGPVGVDRWDWITTALAMHYGSIGQDQHLTVFLSPIVHGIEDEGGVDPAMASPEAIAEDYRALAASPCPVRVVQWFKANNSTRADVITQRIAQGCAIRADRVGAEVPEFRSSGVPKFRSSEVPKA